MNNQLNISALASVDIQKMNKDELVDVSGLALDPRRSPGASGGLYLKSNGQSLLFPRRRLRCQAGVSGQRPIPTGCPFRLLSAEKERALISFPTSGHFVQR